jgi:hypothetical protein
MNIPTMISSVCQGVETEPDKPVPIEKSDSLQAPTFMEINPPGIIPSKVIYGDSTAKAGVQYLPIFKRNNLSDGILAAGAKPKRRDLAAAEVFFGFNSRWTASHVLELLDRCSNLGEREIGRDPLWHARRGSDLKFLFLNLRKILHQLKLTNHFPNLIEVPRKALYRPRRSRSRRAQQSK